jgi:hypothetical protein
VAEGGRHGVGATLVGSRVTGVGVTPTSGLWVAGAGRVHGSGWLTAGAEAGSPVGGGGGGGGGALVGLSSAEPGAGSGLVEACGATDVDRSGSVPGLPRNTSMTTGTATATAVAAINTIVACLVRYHGRGGGPNVRVLMSERS